jgi:hypothetical protein
MTNKITMPKQWNLGPKVKYLTKDCDSSICDYYARIGHHEYCSLNENYKILVYPKNSIRKCLVKDKLTNLEIITKKE